MDLFVTYYLVCGQVAKRQLD